MTYEYVRFLNNDQLNEEMLFARNLKTDTKGETIFEEIKSYFKENNIPLQNITACATDGAASMVGRYRGFMAHLKNAVPEVFLHTLHGPPSTLLQKNWDDICMTPLQL
jgi:hypothetical protein